MMGGFTSRRRARMGVTVAMVCASLGITSVAFAKGDDGEATNSEGQARAEQQGGNAWGQQKQADREAAQGEAGGENRAEAEAQAKPEDKANGENKAGGKAKGHAKQKSRARGENKHAKAGKTTICHATGSATNPYVTITISDNALPAHRRHQDGRDIIPAPAGGCPPQQAGGASGKDKEKEKDKTPGTPGGNGGGQNDKVTICHATGSTSNPYVLITISKNALPAHTRHQDGEDIIDVPETGCPRGSGGPGGVTPGTPGGETPSGGTPGTPGTPDRTTPTGGTTPTTGTTPATSDIPTGAVGGVTESGGNIGSGNAGTGGEFPTGAVLGETAEGGAGGSPAAAEEVQRGADAGDAAAAEDSGSLPFTGLGLVGLLALAAFLLAGGALLRTASNHRRGTGP